MLFDSLNTAWKSLNAASMGIQVAGQNLAHVDTPGYVREQLLLGTDISKRYRQIDMGTGVQTLGVVQVIDEYLEERLRTSVSESANSTTQENVYADLEGLLKELSENDLSTSLDTFYNSISNVLNNPETTSYRDMAVEAGQDLADSIKRIADSLLEMQDGINKRVQSSAEEINKLTKQIQQLNIEISRIESSNAGGTANSLRDDRYVALTALAGQVNIKVTENKNNGTVTVTCGSHILVDGANRDEVYVDYNTDARGIAKAFLTSGAMRSKLPVTAGTVAGLYEGRDTILGDYATKLDQFTHDLIGEFNAVYASGQGLTGYKSTTSLQSIDDPDAALGAAAFSYPVRNGGFDLLITDAKTGVSVTEHVEIKVDPVPMTDPFSLDPAPTAQGTTLNDLIDSINAIEGVSATLTNRNELKITTDSPEVTFAFGNDTSGFLTAMGINTFFTGNGSSTIGVDATIAADPAKFAASTGGVGKDTLNAEKLAAMPETKNAAFDNLSVTAYYRSIINRVATDGGTVHAVSAANTSYQETLQAQRNAVSGVNADDEMLNMLMYQRTYQATARLVTAINEMLTSLLTI